MFTKVWLNFTCDGRQLPHDTPPGFPLKTTKHIGLCKMWGNEWHLRGRRITSNSNPNLYKAIMRRVHGAVFSRKYDLQTPPTRLSFSPWSVVTKRPPNDRRQKMRGRLQKTSTNSGIVLLGARRTNTEVIILYKFLDCLTMRQRETRRRGRESKLACIFNTYSAIAPVTIHWGRGRFKWLLLLGGGARQTDRKGWAMI